MQRNDIYDTGFFDSHTRRSLLSARTILPPVFEILRPKTVVDIGCGEGTWLRAATELGASEILGIDGNYVDRSRLLIAPQDFVSGDLETNRVAAILGAAPRIPFDLVMCLEVAEHLSYSRAESFVEDLTQLGEVILFSAAIPYQYGTNHINEQWPEFWALLFRAQGFLCFDWLRHRFWTHPDVDWWYAQNVLMFARAKSSAAAMLPSESLVTQGSLSLVHPETFLVNLLSLFRVHRKKAIDEERIDFHAVSYAYQDGSAVPPSLQALARAKAVSSDSHDVFPWTRMEIGDPEATIDQLQREQTTELAHHTAELTNIRSQSIESLARLAQLHSEELARQLVQSGEFRARLVDATATIEELRSAHAADIKQRTDEADHMRAQLAERTTQCEQLGARLADATATIEKLRSAHAADIKKRTDEAEYMRAQLAASSAAGTQQKQLHEQETKRHLDELVESRAQVAQLVQRLTMIETSFAWRFTIPMRAIASRFPRLAELGYKLRKAFWRAFTGGMPRPWRRRLRRPVTVELPSISASPPSRSSRLRVIYLSGEPDTPGNAYRIVRYASAARAAGMETSLLRLDELPAKLSEIIAADILVVWRASWNPALAAAVDATHRGGGKVVFDVDDLMFNPDLATAEIIDGIRSQKFPQEVVQRHYAAIREAMAAADFCTAPTESLAFHIRRAYKPAFVLPNGFDEITLEKSRLATRRRRLAPADGVLRIGYAGGTRTHQRDFKQAAAAVARIMRENPGCRLVLFRNPDGNHLLDVTEFPELSEVQDHIEWRNTVPLENLPEELARLDINIAPLEVGNPYCECKSELKYFEAALVDVCTVASPTEPFRRAIHHGENGFLANNPDEWYAALRRLVEDSKLRYRLGRIAFYEALRTYGPRQRVEALRSVVTQIQGDAAGVRAFELDLHRMQAPRPPLPYVPESDQLMLTDRLGTSEISIVVPLYNYAQYVVEALESVRNQTLPILDLIVVDDCSTDNSLEIVLEWTKQHAERFNRVVVMHNRTNQGLGLTRNIGFDAAETPFILPLDADNRLVSVCCEELLAAMRGSGLAFAHPLIRQFGETSYIMGNRPFAPVQLTGGNYIDAMAAIAKDAWVLAGGYDGTRSGWEDFDLWCRMVEAGLCGKQVGVAPLAEYRVHGSSMLRTQTDIAANKRKAISQMEARHFWLTLVDETQRDLTAKWCRSRTRKDAGG
ncbi:MAG: glycosyltransferase [Phycisphaerae bacterium]